MKAKVLYPNARLIGYKFFTQLPIVFPQITCVVR